MRDDLNASMAAIVPSAAICFEQVGELWGRLLPEEAELLTPKMVSKRRLELAAGRTCARSALAALGLPPQPILRGPQREPLWPEGIVGSITHSSGYCASAVAPVDKCAGLGIDAEPNQPLPHGVLKRIARERERNWISKASKGEICWDRLLFSVKESVFKTWYPIERSWLDFDEAEIEIDADKRTFQATLLRATSACPRVMYGGFRATSSIILTCASVPAAFPSSELVPAQQL
jgi:4'-phosphopantetheinyl transferase EntD